MRYQQPTPEDGVPRYFKRDYWGPWMDEKSFEVGHGMLTIYGEHFPSTYEEDEGPLAEVWERRKAFQAMCYSVHVLNGEPGLVALKDVTEITKEEFEAAKARGWQDT